jgi:transglycosylase-like protein with SLT domain
MVLLRNFLTPADMPQTAVLRPRKNMTQNAFYQDDAQQQQLEQQDPTTNVMGAPKQQYQQEPVTGDYIQASLAKYANRAAPPSLQPGARVKTPDMSSVGADNFKSYYDQMGMIGDIGQQQLNAATYGAAYKRQQALAALAGQQVQGFNNPTLGDQGGGGSIFGNPTGGSYQGSAAPAGKGVQRWSGLTLQVMKELGIPESYLPAVLRRMNQESGGNPTIQNNWDSNAKKGTPSIGLMQTIGPTFNSYAGPYRGRGITDPYANIYAGLKYAGTRYGPSHGGFLGGVLYAMNKSGGY